MLNSPWKRILLGVGLLALAGWMLTIALSDLTHRGIRGKPLVAGFACVVVAGMQILRGVLDSMDDDDED